MFPLKSLVLHKDRPAGLSTELSEFNWLFFFFLVWLVSPIVTALGTKKEKLTPDNLFVRQRLNEGLEI